MQQLTAWHSQMLIALQNKLTTVAPEVKWIDQDLGQLEFYDGEIGRPPVLWPCALIDFLSTTYDDMSQDEQWGADTIQIRLGFAPYSYSNDKAPLQVRAKALEYYELEEIICKALYAFDADGLCQPMTNRGRTSEKREDAIRVRVLTFTTTFIDSTMVPETEALPRPILKLL